MIPSEVDQLPTTMNRLGQYELLSEVARGGMGSVWMARNTAPPKQFVAIKTILPHLAGEATYVTMFLEEARLISLIDHPNIVRIVDFGQEGDTYFQAMEWVDGLSLKEVLKASPKPLPFSVWGELLAQACDGLHAAHEARDKQGNLLDVVHRDVSPHNLIVGRDGRVRVIDFGVARSRGRVMETTTSTLKGKVRYMAPEQARCSLVDRRADVWSLGVIAYLLQTGRYPYNGDSDVAVLTSLLESPGPEPLPDDTPPEVAALIRSALERDIADRCPSCAELARQLRAAAPAARNATAEVVRLLESLALPSSAARKRLASFIDQLRRPKTGETANVSVAALAPPDRQTSVSDEATVALRRRASGTEAETAAVPARETGSEGAPTRMSFVRPDALTQRSSRAALGVAVALLVAVLAVLAFRRGAPAAVASVEPSSPDVSNAAATSSAQIAATTPLVPAPTVSAQPAAPVETASPTRTVGKTAPQPRPTPVRPAPRPDPRPMMDGRN